MLFMDHLLRCLRENRWNAPVTVKQIRTRTDTALGPHRPARSMTMASRGGRAGSPHPAGSYAWPGPASAYGPG